MSKNKKKNKSFKQSKPETFNKKKLKNSVIALFYAEPGNTMNYKQISTFLGIKDPETRILINVVLQELHDDGYLDQIARGKYKLKARSGLVVGVVDMQSQGFAYVNSDEIEQPILIPSRYLNHAMEGDKVRIRLFARRKKHEIEGEVIEIVERAKSIFVGTVQTSRNFAFLIPSGKAGFDIFIPNDKLKGAKNGQKAIAEIIEWPSNAKNPIGEIKDVLGDAGNNDAEMHAILAEFELPYKFPVNVDKRKFFRNGIGIKYDGMLAKVQ